ncbi:MAG TPA: YdiU family protein [Gammaproteobacteria bacterium]
MQTLESLNFSNSFSRLGERFFSRLLPTPLANTHLVSFNPAAARLIDLDPREAKRPEFIDYFGGERLLPGSAPLAMLYAGHQFGHYVPQLGDGRAILLGEVKNRLGEPWEVQLKGAGITPYSRRGDGRAVLRSSIREYLCSEAMHGLGIPTTRALALLGSNEEVWRETIEPGALLVRLAPSHVRFGSFEIFYYREQYDALRALADYVIDHHYPDLRDEKKPYLALFAAVVERTAQLIARWQEVGFAHGVMNTDNMSILGLTLDYGPFGFLDRYEPAFICNHTDELGRYAFDQQPAIAHWNLGRLGQALLPLFAEVWQEGAAQANAVLGEYETHFNRAYGAGMRSKLGLAGTHDGDHQLVAGLLQLLESERVDYTGFFRALAGFGTVQGDRLLEQLVGNNTAFRAWWTHYAARLRGEGRDAVERRAAMLRTNPKFVLRNHLAQYAIERAQYHHDYSEIDRLLKLLQTPFDEHPGMEEYAAPPPPDARPVVVSCSS